MKEGVWLTRTHAAGFGWFEQYVNGVMLRADPFTPEAEAYIRKRAERAAKTRATRRGLPYHGLVDVCEAAPSQTPEPTVNTPHEPADKADGT